MAMGIALSMGLREQSILASIFMLHWCTMAFGFLVEYISTPRYFADTTNYQNPITRYEWETYRLFHSKNEADKEAWKRTYKEWDMTPPDEYPGLVDYGRDGRALKIISQVRPLLVHPANTVLSRPRVFHDRTSGKETAHCMISCLARP